MKRLTIQSITCTQARNISLNADIIFLVQVDGGPPLRFPIADKLSVDEGHTLSFPGDYDEVPTYYFNRTCYVSIWDTGGLIEYINAADFLGDHYWDQDATGTHTAELYGVDSSHYQLNLTIDDVSPETVTGMAIPSEVQDAANTALLDYNTNYGTSLLSEIQNGMPKDELQDRFSSDLRSSMFQAVFDAVSKYSGIKAVSLGIMGEVDLFLGIEGAFGWAVDLENFPESSGLFGGGGLVEGVDAAVQGTFALGFWFIPTEEIGGLYEGVEVDVDEGLGVTAVAYAARGDKDELTSDEGINLDVAKVVFIGIDVGLGDGVEAEESYFFSGHVEDYPCYQTGVYKYVALLTDLVCSNQASTASACDNITIEWQADGNDQIYRYPAWNDFEMGIGSHGDDHDDSSHTCGTTVQFNDSVTVYLKIQYDGSLHTIGDPFTISRSSFSAVGDTADHTYDDDVQAFQKVTYEMTAKLIGDYS